jgi:hypoxanthine phosphoribosyltransferase
MEVPPTTDILHDEHAVERAVIKLAGIADLWAKEALGKTGKPLLCLCVLRGGAFFFSDLLLRMQYSVEPAFCRAHSYSKQVVGVAMEDIVLEIPHVDPRGREVMVVDNICDSGRTLRYINRWLRDRGATGARTITMMHRLRSDAVDSPTAAGFTYPGKEWLVGYGMRDGAGLLMNARWIGRLKG